MPFLVLETQSWTGHDLWLLETRSHVSLTICLPGIEEYLTIYNDSENKEWKIHSNSNCNKEELILKIGVRCLLWVMRLILRDGLYGTLRQVANLIIWIKKFFKFNDFGALSYIFTFLNWSNVQFNKYILSIFYMVVPTWSGRGDGRIMSGRLTGKETKKWTQKCKRSTWCSRNLGNTGRY